MKKNTLNDLTQQMLLPHLETTEELLSRVSTKLSGVKKDAEITAMPDLGIAHNCTRMMGGFFTGACYVWDSTVPFIPVDATVNVCGTAVFKLSKEISILKFLERVETVLSDRSRYTWNYTNGNHFISLCRSNGEYDTEFGYYMVVHASANEFKNGPNGLYPNSDVWYYDAIQTEYLEGTSRYLRYIAGTAAERFYEIAKMLISFNEERNRFFIKSVLREYMDKEVLSIQHYGMPNNHTICIGTHWEPKTYTLLTAPGRPIFLIEPDKNFQGSPHGFGLALKKTNIEFTGNSITIGEKTFRLGESINIGADAINRCSSPTENLDDYVSCILKACPGKIIGKLEQIVSISKDGTKIWQDDIPTSHGSIHWTMPTTIQQEV